MTEKLRPEVSKKSQYWLPKFRFYELKYFCRQYPVWKEAYTALDGLSRRPDNLGLFRDPGQRSDPTERCVESRLFYARRMEMVEQSALEADPDMYNYILLGVTEGLSYDNLRMQYAIPCCRDTYYSRYRRFFWLLSKRRD